MSNNFDIQQNRRDHGKTTKNGQLDIEFDQLLANMKKYVLDLKDKKCKLLKFGNFDDIFCFIKKKCF